MTGDGGMEGATHGGARSAAGAVRSETHAVRLYSAMHPHPRAVSHSNHSNHKNPSSDSYMRSINS